MSEQGKAHPDWYHAGRSADGSPSFPIGPNGEQLREAWNLAGHAPDPDRVRRNIKNYARRIGKLDLLPDTAKESMKKALTPRQLIVQKARQEVVHRLLHHAWHSAHGDRYRQELVADIAHEHDIVHMLPDEAHGLLHELGIHHTHEGMAPDHEHEITKAYNPIGKSWVLEKAWGDGDEAFIEGWLSTPDVDLEQDVVEPEAFMKSVDGYFLRRAPVSYIHDKHTLPAGHLQKAAIVRDGRILKSAAHPTDPAEFEHFPGTGTGVYVRGRLTDPQVATAVKKGNVGGFSFIGNGKTYTPRVPKGRHFTEVDPWIESTVAPYPINYNAVITVAKAYGLEPPNQSPEVPMNDELLAALKVLLGDPNQEPQVAKSDVTMEKLEQLLTGHTEKLLDEVDNRIRKAVDLVREEGVGTKATVIKSVLPQENPLYPLLQKAEHELTLDEKTLIGEATIAILTKGMNGSTSDEIKYL
jgi:hypothetical protein